MNDLTSLPLAEAELRIIASLALGGLGVPSEVRRKAFLDLANEIHADNLRAGWWTDLATGERLPRRNFGEVMALIWSEVCEAYDAETNDDKLPQYHGFPVEMADAMIRQLDLIGSDTFGSKQVIADAFVEFFDGPLDRFYPVFELRDLTSAWCEVFELGRKGKPFEAEFGQFFGMLLAQGQGWLLTFHPSNLISNITVDKQLFNRSRVDHKLSHRQGEGGKKI